MKFQSDTAIKDTHVFTKFMLVSEPDGVIYPRGDVSDYEFVWSLDGDRQLSLFVNAHTFVVGRISLSETVECRGDIEATDIFVQALAGVNDDYLAMTEKYSHMVRNLEQAIQTRMHNRFASFTKTISYMLEYGDYKKDTTYVEQAD